MSSRIDGQHLDETPLRGDRPRYRRTNSELLLAAENSTSSRQWFLESTPYQKEAVDGSSEPCHTQDLPNLINRKTVQASLPITRETYPGDRFIPRRHGHNFEVAYHLIKQQPYNWEDKVEMDYCKEAELSDITYRREAMRAMIISQECVPGLNQKRVLQTFVDRCHDWRDSAELRRSGPETAGKWKCMPRKKPLIKRPEKMLSLSTSQDDELTWPVDWSCTDMFVVGSQNGLTIYDSSGAVLDTLRLNDAPSAVKWSNNGDKIACTFRSLMQLKVYDLQKRKVLWSVSCYCSTAIYTVNSCRNCCICWSQDDRLIVTACLGTLSMFQSHTGKLLSRKHMHAADIIILQFSANFKYLVSTARDKCVQIYIWPNLQQWYNIEFSTSIKALAWHPETSGLLCVGGSKNATLSLWNINTCTLIDYLPAKFKGRVENLAWNKLSGELVVHWTYAVQNTRHCVIPVLANFQKTVDAIPLNKDERLSFLKFDTTHQQLLTYNKNIFTIWNFFGDEKPPEARCLPLYSTGRQKQGIIVHNPIR